jgi:ADP-heptose:LPS heptosyltransferase
MQVNASAILRTYPYDYQNQLIKLFGKKGFKTLLLDHEESIISMIKAGIFDREAVEYIVTPYSKEITGSILLSIALVKRCKLLIAPDSFFVYVGDSFGIPTLGIYSPINSMLRAHGLNVYALDVVDGCYNCSKHTQSPCPWSKDTWSPCLKSIKPEYVDFAVSEILAGNK